MISFILVDGVLILKDKVEKVIDKQPKQDFEITYKISKFWNESYFEHYC